MDFGYVIADGEHNVPAPAIGVHTITIPSAALFYGRPPGGVVLPPSFVFDLFSITDLLRDAL